MPRSGDIPDELDEVVRAALRAHRAGLCADDCSYCEREQDAGESDASEDDDPPEDDPDGDEES